MDRQWKGRDRKLLVHFDRNGFAYMLDRLNGELLGAEKFDPAVNWASGVDLKTGLPTRNPAMPALPQHHFRRFAALSRGIIEVQ